MIRDNPAKNYLWATPLAEADLYDATSNLIQQGNIGAEGGRNTSS